MKILQKQLKSLNTKKLVDRKTVFGGQHDFLKKKYDRINLKKITTMTLEQEVKNDTENYGI